jgi:carbon-monoxide dehydrogenase small subunit
MMSKRIQFRLNDDSVALDVQSHWTALRVIRDELGWTGTKEGCGEGDCGACTILVDGKAVNACLMLAADMDGTHIITIEGLARGDELDPLQRAFLEKGAVQCGFCTPGMVLTAKAFLDTNADPTEEEIRFAIAGNLCRCTGYGKIVEAIQAAAKTRNGGKCA